MLKKLVLVLSCACAMNTCFAHNIADNVEADAEAAAAYNCLYDAQGRIIYASDRNKAYEYAGGALTAYQEARATTDKRIVNAKYAEAIKNINLALAIIPESAEYKLLAAQIYRYRGGLSYAKNYFAQACMLYEKQLKDYPDSITLNLQYAIACYAGDARYYPDYEGYKSRAVLYAGKTLKLLENNKNQYSEADTLLPRLLAYVLLQDYNAAAKTVKRINSICGKYSPSYALAEEYERLTANGQWLWRVSRKEDAEKDFLLYSVDEWGI